PELSCGGADRLLVPCNLDTSSLAISLPMASSSLVVERGVLYGVSAQTKSPIIIDPFDEAVGNALRVFKREFDAFWGPRMQDAFRFALMALFESNEAICRIDPIAGRTSPHTQLQV